MIDRNALDSRTVTATRVRKIGTAALAGIAALYGVLAQAGNQFSPYAQELFEHDSNIFYLPSNGPIPVGSDGKAHLGGDFVRSMVGVEDDYSMGRQVAFITAEGRRFDYLNFNYLTHYEGLLDGGLDWRLGSAWDGTLEYRFDRHMVDFAALLGTTALEIETDKIASAATNLRLTPVWRLETKLQDRTLDSPRPEALQLQMHEDSILLGLRYLGIASLSAGTEFEYVNGKFEHDFIGDDPHYHDWTARLAANYAVTGLTTFNAAAGYTRRNDEGGPAVGGFTGALGYKRAVTGKTFVTVKLQRAINSYVSTTGSEVDTLANVGATWNITYKTLLSAGYTYDQIKYPDGQGTPDFAQFNRSDRTQFALVEARHEFLHWLALRAYARYQVRHSSIDQFNYNSTGVGIELQAYLPNRQINARAAKF